MMERLLGGDWMPGGGREARRGEMISDQGEGVSLTIDKAV